MAQNMEEVYAARCAGMEDQKEAEAEGYDPWENAQYFDSYADFEMQRQMLADTRRNAAFRVALDAACSGQVVLDVGCGSGILSLFAARAGARRVYACEASDMACYAHAVVVANGLQDKVFVTQQRAERVDLGEKVDVLVSEWLGSFAFFESMVEAVIVARDRLLKEGGAMLPSSVSLWCAPVLWQDPQEAFWSARPEGFDFGPLAAAVRAARMQRPIHSCAVPANALLAEEQLIARFDMARLTVDNLERIASPEMEFRPAGERVSGLVVWFDADFSPFAPCLSTSPKLPPTHWSQEVLLLTEELVVPPDAAVHMRLTIIRNAYWRRHYTLHLEGEVRCGEQVVTSFSKLFPHHRFPPHKQEEEEEKKH